MALAAEYLKKAGFPRASTRATRAPDGRRQRGRGRRGRRGGARHFEKLGFKVNSAPVPHNTMYTKFCNVPTANVAVCPNVGWLKDFADAQTMLDPTFNGKNIFKRTTPTGRSSTTRRSTTRWTRPKLADDPRSARRRGPRSTRRSATRLPRSRGCGTRTRDPLRQRQRCRHAQLRAVDISWTSLKLSHAARGPARVGRAATGSRASGHDGVDVAPPLPPDLERLGEALTHATSRAAAIRRARRIFAARLAACVAAAVMVFAATAPSRLGHADVAFPPDSGGVVSPRRWRAP